ncbi:MAG: acyl-CoA dehydrogenase family protein [Saprospiraceae bacterium]|jgi:alkylation response protein AidB-like acyl-CoA dehydrogenase|nr:acyl-CoA dehydrogenase family protein [Saprospiraceae bacterium]
MQDTLVKSDVLKGGEYLIKPSKPEDTFIPEQINEEQQMIKETVKDYVYNEIVPKVLRLEKQEEGLSVELLRKGADLGLLGSHMPEIYGGMEMDTNTNTLICETLGPAGGFTVSFAAHTGIGMLPILYFGSEDQKAKYLPGLISGELQASYCLTEPSSGSDALAAKTRADLSEDGTHYILNGQKMWISNAGFADIFIVFAQVDGDKFTGFIVEKGLDGLTLGAEELKLGIKSSSTRQVFLENVKVPKENVLGEIGKGHLIAFNVLNIGRFKLCALSLGGAKASATTGIQYANERKQFKQPIANFGAIKYKIAQQAIRLFASESALYRVSNLIQEKNKEEMAKGASFAEAKLIAAEEYAIECALLKISGSEALDYVVDETLQIHGGMGYSEEGTAARAYRDSRINRIYEGTNEINRLLSVNMLLKKAMKGQLDIVGPAWAVQKELSSMPSFDKLEGAYAEETKAVEDFKKLILMVAGGAAKMQMDGKLDLRDEQEIIMNVSDMLLDLLEAESTLLRVQRLAEMDTKFDQDVYDAILKTFITDVTAKMNKNATDALVSFVEGDLLRTFLMGVKRFTKYTPTNVKAARRKIANTMIEANEYCF